MHNHHNGLKTAVLLASMLGLVIAFGAVLSASTRNVVWLVGASVLSLGMTAYSYWNSDKLALRSMGAYAVTPLEQPEMYRIVEELSARAGQPMPRLYVSPTATPNAFATGRNPQNAAVCCTQGILDLLNERELRGVLGHELMHVYNRDILTSSIAAGIGSVITSAAQFMLFFGGRDRRNGNPIAMLLAAVLAPIAAMVIQMAVSRTREYDADEDGARLTGDPLALASALQKLHAGTQARPLQPTMATENVSHLMIANPFGSLRNVFSTHPPMDKRVARLEAMAGYGQEPENPYR